MQRSTFDLILGWAVIGATSGVDVTSGVSVIGVTLRGCVVCAILQFLFSRVLLNRISKAQAIKKLHNVNKDKIFSSSHLCPNL